MSNHGQAVPPAGSLSFISREKLSVIGAVKNKY